MGSNDLPIIDWEQNVKQFQNKKEVAAEMLNLFIKNLAQDIALITQSHQKKKYHELLHHVHRMHGTLCYLSLPRLKSVIAQLESQLKNNIMANLAMLIDQLDIEKNLILEQHSHLRS